MPVSNRFALPFAQPVNANGLPLAGARLYFFASGTSTPLNTYSDAALATPNANPVIADSAGRFPAIFLGNSAYKVALKTAEDVPIRTDDPVSGMTVLASDIGYTLAATGAVATTADAIFGERVSVKAHFGAKGDGVTDDTAALQKAINYAISTGKTLHVPSGRYKITSTLTADMSANVNDYGSRFWMDGEGGGNSVFVPTAAVTGACLNIKGGAAKSDAGYQVWSGISRLGFEGTTMDSGYGIFGTNLAFFRMDSVRMTGFEYGCYFRDILTSLFNSVNIRYCKYGFYADRQDSSPSTDYGSDPNALTFINCTFGLCRINGASLIRGAGNVFIGCTFEGNGIPVTGGDGVTGYTVLLSNMGREGIVGATFVSCYFENNAVSRDIWISQGENDASYNFQGCTFARVGSLYALSNIFVEQDGTCRAVVNVDGCGFKSLSGYVEDASRPYIAYDISPYVLINLGHGNLFGANVASPYGSVVPTFRAALSAPQTIANAVTGGSLVNFDAADINECLWYDTTNKAFVAIKRCRMMFHAQLWFSDIPSGGTASVTIIKTTSAGATTDEGAGGVVSGGSSACATAFAMINLDEGDFVRVLAYQDSGGSRTLLNQHFSLFSGHPC